MGSIQDRNNFELERALMRILGDANYSKLIRAQDVLQYMYRGNASLMARELGLPQPSLYRALNPDPETRPGTLIKRLYELTERLKAVPGIDANWVENGGGTPPWDQSQETNGREGKMPDEEQRGEFLDENETQVVSMPMLWTGHGAGPGRIAQEDEVTTIDLPTLYYYRTLGRLPHNAYWTFVRGESMLPWLKPGTPICVERCKQVSDSGRYVISLDDDEGEMIKRLERLPGKRLAVTSDNPAHSNYELEHIDEEMWREVGGYNRTFRLRIVGQVILPDDTNHSFLMTFMAQTTSMLKQSLR